MNAHAIRTADFRGLEIPVIEHAGEHWITGEQIGRALGYEYPREAINKIFSRNEHELSEYSLELELTSQPGLRSQIDIAGPQESEPRYHGDVADRRTADAGGQRRKVRVYNEEGVMVLTMLSSQPVAREFRRWAVAVLKAYRQGGLARETGETERLRATNAELRDKVFELQQELVDIQRRYIGAIDVPAKPKRRKLSAREKAHILDLARRGWNRAAIVADTGRPEGTVSSLISRAQREGRL
jgi:prophage antirepressor-like protein